MHQKQTVMKVLTGKYKCVRHKIRTKDRRVITQPFSDVLDKMYDRVMAAKLDEWDPQYFQKQWLYDAAMLAYEDLKDDMRHLLPKPEKRICEYVIRRFDPDMRAGYWSGARGEEVFHPTIDKSEHLPLML